MDYLWAILLVPLGFLCWLWWDHIVFWRQFGFYGGKKEDWLRLREKR